MRTLHILAFLIAIGALAPGAFAQASPEPDRGQIEVPTVAALAPVGVRPPAAPIPAATLHTTDRPAPGLRRFADWAVGDIVAVGNELTPTRLGIAATFVMLLPFLSTQDASVGRTAPQLRGDLSSPPLDVADEFGAARMQWVSGLVFASTLLTDNARLQDAAFTSFEAGVYAMLVSGLAKGLVGRARPSDAEGPFEFEPFSGQRSFPSGHTTLAFALVTPWVVYYPKPWTFGLYALSTGTALARLSEEAHWVTDVIAGAALGTITGYWLARRHLAQTTPLRVTPRFGLRGGGLTLSYSF